MIPLLAAALFSQTPVTVVVGEGWQSEVLRSEWKRDNWRLAPQYRDPVKAVADVKFVPWTEVKGKYDRTPAVYVGRSGPFYPVFYGSGSGIISFSDIVLREIYLTRDHDANLMQWWRKLSPEAKTEAWPDLWTDDQNIIRRYDETVPETYQQLTEEME